MSLFPDNYSRGDGHNPHWFVELMGGKEVIVQNWEPDAQTFRGEYYYNARLDRLYKKIPAVDRQLVVYYWKPVSEI